MKKIVFLFTLVFSLGLFWGCETDFIDAVLDVDQSTPPAITSPEDGTILELSQDQSSEIALTISWNPVLYNLEGLEDPRYVVYVDVAGNNFANRVELAAATSTSVTLTHQALNNRLMQMGLEHSVAHQLEIRVVASLDDNAVYDNLGSTPVGLTVTPYDAEAVTEVKPIYMLGNGTEVGWDNVNPLEMYHIEGGEFALVANLGQAGEMVKFLSVPGQWAPQWGQAEGDAESGTLAYRPTEDVADPDPIDISALDPGYYRVVADTAALTYTITPSTDVLYMLGSATEVQWDNAAPLEMTMDSPGIFTIVTTLTAGDESFLKFLEVIGQWAPQYGTDAEGTWESGNLVYRFTESEPDPPGIPGPEVTGTYLIEVNLSSMTYTVTAQ